MRVGARQKRAARRRKRSAIMFESIIHQIVAFIEANRAWAPVIAGALAFCESLAVISFFVPATVILVAIGGMIVPANLPFWAIWGGAAVGAILGDWLSYVVGRYFKDDLLGSKLYERHRESADKAMAFMRKWGAAGVFIGRFSGPLRAFVPLAAGLIAIPQWLFQFANVTSAIIWAGVLLSPGTLLGEWLNW